MALADTARLIATLELDDRKFQRGVNNSVRGVGRMQRGFSDLGRGVNKLGTRLAAGVAVGLGAAAKAAIDWEDAFQGVVKTVDEADLARAGLTFDQLGESIRAMSREMPNSAVELAGIAEQAGALGIKAKDIEAFTRQVAILASTTDVSADDAATALGQLQNVIGLTGAEFDNFAASLVQLGNTGASTESQILEIARRAGGAAKLFGIGKDDILGWASAAANLGINSESAGTSLQNVFLKLLPKISDGSKAVTKVFGVSGDKIKKMFRKDASGALELFIKKLARLPKSARLERIQAIFGKGSGITRLLLGLTGEVDGLTDSLDTSEQAWKDATAAQEEFDKRNATVRSAISRLKNNVIDAAVTIGEGFAPALGEAADKLSDFLKSPENRELLKGIGRDIGEAIRGINWDRVIDAAKSVAQGLKPALDLVLRIGDVIAGLPPGVIGAGGALLLGDRLSGGLITGGLGGIVGGLGESIAKSMAAKIPVFGKAFVQPVFVTNPGFGVPGGGKGGPMDLIPKAAPMGLLALGGTALTGTAAGVGASALLKQAQEWIGDALFGQGAQRGAFDAGANNIRGLSMGPFETLRQAITGEFGTKVDKFVNAIQGKGSLFEGGLLDPKINGTAQATPRNPGEIMAGNLQKLEAIKTEQTNTIIQLATSERAAAISAEAIKQTAGSGLSNVQSAATTAGSLTTGAVNSASSAIQGAIAANRAIVTTNVAVNVTAVSVEKATVTANKTGPQQPDYGTPWKYEKP